VPAAGLLDDARFAETRARALAARGAGDRLVVDDLLRAGVAEATAHAAVATLEPEPARASRIVESRGRTTKTLRYLVSRGFAEESVDGLVAELEDRAVP
jgi:SOS response regulatory protein OraA/RecX